METLEATTFLAQNRPAHPHCAPQQPHVPDLCSPTAPLHPLLGPPHRWEPGRPHAGGSAHISPALAKPWQEKGKGRNRPGEDPTGAQGPAEVAVWHTWAR